MKILKRLTIFLFLFFAGAYLYMSWTLSDQILIPVSSMERTKSIIANEWGTTFEEISKTLPKPEPFMLFSFDQTPITGRYFQKSDTANCAIIMAHGWTVNWAGMLKYAQVFSDCRCDLVMYDHRMHGESGGDYATGGIHEAKDLLAVTEWVQEKTKFKDHQIGWFGASWGGSAVLNAGADKKNVAFIIADAPFQDWYSAIFERAIRDHGAAVNFMSFGVMQMVNWRAGIDYTEASAINAASNIDEPVLLIHSQTDEATNSQQSVNISKKLNPSKSTFHHLDWGGGHTKDVIINREKFQKLINDFLRSLDGDFMISRNDFNIQN